MKSFRALVGYWLLTALLWVELAQGGVLTPFRRGFTLFRGGRIVLTDPKAPPLVGLDFVDLGQDLPVETVEINKKKQYRIRFRAKFLRPNWSLTLNGDPLEAQASGELEGAFILDKEGGANLAIAAVSARGEVEELAARFEFYDWELFLKERDLESKWVREGLVWGELGFHHLTDSQNAVITTTPAILNVPHAVTEWSWWNERLPESRSWWWRLRGDVGFALPLQGQLWAPPFSVNASVLRRNLFNPATIAGVRVPWHPGARLRFEGYSQGAEALAPTGPAVVTQSFVPRYSMIAWLDVFVESDLSLGAFRLVPQVYFAHSIVGTSFRSDNLSAFLPGGWSGGLKARLNLPAPRERMFATLDFRYQALTGSTVSVITDLALALGFGYTFP